MQVMSLMVRLKWSRICRGCISDQGTPSSTHVYTHFTAASSSPIKEQNRLTMSIVSCRPSWEELYDMVSSAYASVSRTTPSPFSECIL